MEIKIVKATVLVVMVVISNSFAGFVSIGSVDIIPEQPTVLDMIKIDISGNASSRPNQIAYEDFLQNGTQFRLDLHMDIGVLPAISEWTYEKQIAPLNAGTYSLEVRLFDNYYDMLIETYDPVCFTVVPEPATYALFGLGLVTVRRFSKVKK